MRHRQERPTAAAASLHHDPGSFPSRFHSNRHLHSPQPGVEASPSQSAGSGRQQQQQVRNAALQIFCTSGWSVNALMHE